MDDGVLAPASSQSSAARVQLVSLEAFFNAKFAEPDGDPREGLQFLGLTARMAGEHLDLGAGTLIGCGEGEERDRWIDATSSR